MADNLSSRQFASYQITSLAEWCRSRDLPFHLIADANSDDEKVIRFPGVASGHTFKYSRPAIYAGRVDDVRILPSAGYMTTNDGKVIFRGLIGTDVLPELNLGKYLGRIDPPDRLVIDMTEGEGKVAQECIYIGGQANFGHFLYENLARLATLNWFPELQPLPIAVYDDLPRRYYEFLDIYGYPPARRINISRSAPTRFSRVWRVSSPMYRKSRRFLPLIWPDALWALRSGAAHLMRPLTKYRPRYFLLRTGIQWRRLLNEPQILAMLRTYHVEPIDLAGRSASAQIEAVAEAEMIISVAGAGPAITLYAPADCLMIELTVPGFKPVYSMYGYAAILEQPAIRVTGRRIEARSQDAQPLRPQGKKFAADSDFEIDVDELERIVEAGANHLKAKTGLRPRNSDLAASLEDLCANDQQPFRQIAAENFPPSRVLGAAGAPERRWNPYRRQGAVAGRVLGAIMAAQATFTLAKDGKATGHERSGHGLGHIFQSPADFGKIERRIMDETIIVGGSIDLDEFITRHLLRLTLLDWLPDLQGLPAVIYDDLPQPAIDLLALFGRDDGLLVRIPRSVAVCFDRAWLFSTPVESVDSAGWPSIWPDAIWAARLRLAYLTKPITAARPRVYLKSSRIGQTAPGNIELFEVMLERCGLSPLDTEALGIRQGLATLSNAEILVILPGTTSALAVFAACDCTVIELTTMKPRDAAGPLEFASVLGQPYVGIGGHSLQPTAAPQTRVDAHYVRDQAVTDLANIERVLDAAIAHCEAKATLRLSSYLRA